MNASSASAAERLAKVNTKQICHLLRLVAESRTPEVKHIERLYLDNCRHFEETLEFLRDLRWIDLLKGQLTIGEPGRDAVACAGDDTVIRNQILDALIDELSPYREILAEYLSRYKVSGSVLRYRPSISERTRHLAVRDLLMDLRAVAYKPADVSYTLSQGAAELYVWARNASQIKSKERFKRELAGRDEVGVAGELVVLAFERQRVGERWAAEVHHVSAESPFACYDIRSVTVDGDVTERRFIEVKAISQLERRFFWSKAEVEAAQLLGRRYFLYLVPVSSQGFKLEALTMIQDPYECVYKNSASWLIEQDVIICTERRVQDAL